ncbi:MAG: AbrB/MazE/SpoVT family DNA-binding domain-containing protein [Nitrososphaerota archaeon]
MPRLEERRLQQLRGSSYVLTLPKDWVEELGLGKGSSVFLLAEPGLLIVVPSEKAGGLLVDIDLDVVGEKRLEDVTRVLYKIGASQVRFRTRAAVQELMSRLRRLRREIHGFIVTTPRENQVEGAFSDEVFASLDQGVRVFLMTLASAAQTAVRQEEMKDIAALPDEVADCRLYAHALFRHVSGLLTKPSRDIVIQAISLASVIATRLLDLCNSFEDVVSSRTGSGLSENLIIFAELVSELTDAIGGDHDSLERVGGKVEKMLADEAVRDCKCYVLFRTLSQAINSLRDLYLLKTVIAA